MKRFFLMTSALLLGSAAVVMAQSAPEPNPQVMGRGRGGAPYAWNDKNKDGICDITGRPVGQGPRGAGMQRGRGRGARCGFGMQRRGAQVVQPQKQ